MGSLAEIYGVILGPTDPIILLALGPNNSMKLYANVVHMCIFWKSLHQILKVTHGTQININLRTTTINCFTEKHTHKHQSLGHTKYKR